MAKWYQVTHFNCAHLLSSFLVGVSICCLGGSTSIVWPHLGINAMIINEDEDGEADKDCHCVMNSSRVLNYKHLYFLRIKASVQTFRYQP